MSSAALFLLAAALFLTLGAALSPLLVLPFRAPLGRLSPELRHRVLFALACAPALLSITSLAAAAMPALQAWAVPASDHCLVDDELHVHLCFIHLPRLGGVVLSVAAVLLAVGALQVLSGLLALGRMHRVHRLLRLLFATSTKAHGVNVVESDEPVCLTAGLWSPRVLVSRRLLESLDERQRAIVLEHERAHARRRDALWFLVARTASQLHLPSVRRWLLDELELAAEQACDEAAALTSDRLAVAETVLVVARAGAHAQPFSVAFGASAIERRVQSLLAPRRVDELAPVGFTVFAVMALLLSSAEVLHHAAESALSFFVD